MLHLAREFGDAVEIDLGRGAGSSARYPALTQMLRAGKNAASVTQTGTQLSRAPRRDVRAHRDGDELPPDCHQREHASKCVPLKGASGQGRS